MRRLALIMLVVLSCISFAQAEPKPATRPATTQAAKTFSDYASIYKLAPQDARPKAGNSWKQINFDLVNEWFNKHIKDANFSGNLLFKSAEKGEGGKYRAALVVPHFNAMGLGIDGIVHVTLQSADATKAAKLRAGDTVRVKFRLKNHWISVSGSDILIDGSGDDCAILK